MVQCALQDLTYSPNFKCIPHDFNKKNFKPNHTYKSIGQIQIQIHQTTVWCAAGRWHIPVKNPDDLPGPIKCVYLADDNKLQDMMPKVETTKEPWDK